MLISGLKYSKNCKNPKNSWIILHKRKKEIDYIIINQEDTIYFTTKLFFGKNGNYRKVI